ncbi:aspartoacylase [Moorena producens PAL-8-15-08-1]|uniref:Probable aspartoacylase n=1 Tax=Moorena producens PAL-8-15-08-1 TaxID=1458985 RepID=A0A1D8TVI0_9CYAN|nr:aspartoacylase [Moorena producens]AOX01543.1 aspartoacylase [Moorena producens PAL-8-15-08-1]
MSNSEANNLKTINKVAIVGGTHGNEFTGVYLVKKFDKFPELITRPSFETLTKIGNPQAFKAARRYIDTDLNRCFAKSDLENPELSLLEQTRAKEMAKTLGPKGNSQVDFILDLHSSSANMGFTIILVNNDPFNLQLAAYLSSLDPLVRVLSSIEPGKENPFVNSLCNFGCSIEVGPIAPASLKGDIFQKTEALIYATLDYIEDYNNGKLLSNTYPLTIYHYFKVVDYPRNEAGELEGMIHPQLQGRDYQELNPGDPMFLTFDGTTIYYEEEATVWPVFINEVAYYEKGVAMCLTKKEIVSV